MSLATATQRRGLERFMAILSAIAVFMSLMVMMAPTALAHHPEISANQTCADKQVRIAYESVSWKTDGTSGSGHSDIRIEVQVNGSGPWTEVAGGSYTAGNNFRFSGTFDGAPYWGDTIVVRARADGAWDNGVGGGQTTTTSALLVTQDCFNPSCPGQYLQHKVDPVSAGAHGTYFSLSDITDGASGPTFDWSGTAPVFQVIVKGGPGANVYDYPGGETADTGLHAPLNVKNGKWYGLSHITFCYGEPEPDPDPVHVTPSPQVCEVMQGAAQGAVTFNIDPASGATVQVYRDAGHTDPVGGILGDDETLSLSPGTYHWVATAATGDFELKGPSSGQFTIDPCISSVVVTSDDCVLNSNGVPMGSATVIIDPASGATVQITGPGGPYVFSGSGGSRELAPGTYAWVATPGAGFALTGDTGGTFDIEPCSSSVVVAPSNCAVNANGSPTGSVQVIIDPASGATVQITGTGGPYVFSGGGGAQELAPGTYAWVATPASGFAMAGDTSGRFAIDPCPATVWVSGVCVLDGDVGSGLIQVVISTPGAVTLEILDGATVVDTLISSGTVSVPEGRTYTWSATSSSGYAIEGADEGSILIEACSRSLSISVEGVCELDVPILRWTVTPIGFTATEATITWLDIDSADPLHSSVQPLSGEMVWPGAVVGDGKAVDWPGWVYVDEDTKQPIPLGTDGGTFIQGSDGYENTRPTTLVRFEVNPTAVVEVDYPGGTPTCAGPDEVLGEVIVNPDPVEDEIEDDVVVAEELPFTGIDSEQLFGASIVLLGSGLYLIRHARRRGED